MRAHRIGMDVGRWKVEGGRWVVDSGQWTVLVTVTVNGERWTAESAAVTQDTDHILRRRKGCNRSLNEINDI